MKLVSATGVVGDAALFPQHPSADTKLFQDKFYKTFIDHPPKVIVVTSYSWPADRYNYEKLRNWPEFTAALAKQYRLEHEAADAPDAVGYRLYLRKDVGDAKL
jgi:hypothetical protein